MKKKEKKILKKIVTIQGFHCLYLHYWSTLSSPRGYVCNTSRHSAKLDSPRPTTFENSFYVYQCPTLKYLLFCLMTSFALVLQKKLFIKKMRKNTQNFHKHSLLLLFYFMLIVSLYKNDKTELIKKNLCFQMCFPIFKPEAFSP